MMSNFYIPRFKYELVDFFVKQNILTRSKAERMKKNNLEGKYFEIRKGTKTYER